MTTLAIANSPGYGMLGSHPDGDYALPGQVFLSSTDVPPESLVYGLNIEVGDSISYAITAQKSGGGTGTLSIDSIGVPTINGSYGTYDITATWTNQTNGTPVSLYNILPHTDEAAIEAQFNYLPLDENGWSIITPSADSRLIYVDSTNGNDATATHYLPSTLPNVDNWNDPGAVQPFQTFTAALAAKRQDYPDWILLKRGEEFSFSGKLNLKNGRSVTERSVITAYGSPGTRPHLNPIDFDSLLRYWGNSGAYFGVMKGVMIYPTWADPTHADWDPVNGFNNRPDGITVYNGPIGGASILIEDCDIRHCAKNLRVFADLDSEETNTDIIFRRSISQYAIGQGFFANASSVLVEENFFYHNGWWTQVGVGDPDGQATIFDHSLYCPSLNNSIIRNNLSFAPSSIHFKLTSNTDIVDTIKTHNVILYNNFMFEGEVALSLGGNNDQDTGHRWRDMRTAYNVATRIGATQPTSRNLAWGADVQDWNGGMISQDLYFNYGSSSTPNVSVVKLMGHCANITVSDIIAYDIGAATGTSENSGQGFATVAQNGIMTNCQVIRPIIQLPTTDCRIVGKHEALTGVTFTDGKYYSAAAANNQFEYNGTAMNHADWVTNTGDTGTLSQVNFVDSNRTIVSYLTSVGEAATEQQFIDTCLNRADREWNNIYTARYLNSYIREGFKQTAETATVNISTTDVPPESLVYGLAIEVGDLIEYNVPAISDSGDVGSIVIDSLGVPTIMGPIGMYEIIASWTNQTTGIPVEL